MCAACSVRLRLTLQLSLKGPDPIRCLQAHRQSPSPHHLRKRTRSQGPLLRRRCPASTLVRPCPTPALAVACRDVEAATLAHDGPRLPEPPSRRAVPITPADRAGARVDYFPAHAAFPKWQEGRHPHLRLETLASFAVLHATSSGRQGIDIFQSPSVGDFGNGSSFTSSCVIEQAIDAH